MLHPTPNPPSRGTTVWPPELVDALAAADMGISFALDLAPLCDRATARREVMVLRAGNCSVRWHVADLFALCRGNAAPPDTTTPPAALVPTFATIERAVLGCVGRTLQRIDDDMVSAALSTVRRRPRTRSLGLVHDVVWQATAMALVERPLSVAEIGAVLRRIEASVRSFSTGPGSSAYLEMLAGMFAD